LSLIEGLCALQATRPAQLIPRCDDLLNRAALILRYKQPFVDWINAADPSPTLRALTLAEANQEHTVYLVDVEDEDELAEWLVRHHQELLEEELNRGTRTQRCGRGTGRSRRCGSGFVRAPHRRGGHQSVSARRRRVRRMRYWQHATLRTMVSDPYRVGL
jgi:hypothetical protein